MNAEVIKQVITSAIQHEQHSHLLKRRLGSLQNGLNPLLGLSQENATETLMEFILQYASHIPEFIEILEEGAKQTQLQRFISPFVAVATQYFVSPPAIIAGHEGWEGVMGQAYLAHRLFEEVNDIFWSRAGYPLIPLDTNQANVIVHAIIGEPFANELDQAITGTVMQLAKQTHNFDNESIVRHLQENSRRWKESSIQWPCLAGQLGLDLKLRQFYLHAI